MPKKTRFLVVGCELVIGVAAIVLVVVLPEVRAQQVVDDLEQRIVQAISALNLAPGLVCSYQVSNPQETADEAAYNPARAAALANLLAAPEVQPLSLQELETIFSDAVAVATGTDDGARFVDEQNDFVLVVMKIPFCAHRHQYSYLPPLYVFSRTGEYWELGPNVPANIEWIEDRWVGLVEVETSSYPLLSFAHIVQDEGQWRIQFFSDVPNDPGLTYLESATVIYGDGYRQITLPDSDFRYAPAPCEFGDILRTLTSLSSSTPTVGFSHSWYVGDLTYAWVDGHYILTDDTPYEVTAVLNDLSRLEEEPPTETERAEAQNFLRPGSWRDYCLPTGE
jgi:hypothetical protein